ncbi:MAG: hypothetical protein WDM88_06270 [Galbitalea sp.]
MGQRPFVAIALVVVGHATLELIAASNPAYAVYLFIYLFQVPVFVTISGYFAKSTPPGVPAVQAAVHRHPRSVPGLRDHLERHPLGDQRNAQARLRDPVVDALVSARAVHLARDAAVPRRAALSAGHQHHPLGRRGLPLEHGRHALAVPGRRDAAVLSCSAGRSGSGTWVNAGSR